MTARRVPIRRIYNRAIVDELDRKKIKLPFDFRDELDVEWAGHPNWYFRISKFSIPYLKHPCVPGTWFLDQLDAVPDDQRELPAEAAVFVRRAGHQVRADRGRHRCHPRRYSATTTSCRSACTSSRSSRRRTGRRKMEIRMMYVWLDEAELRC